MTRIDTRWNAPASPSGEGPPFDAAALDRLMEDAGLDAVVATSRHNVRYLMGGYSFFFFDHFDAIGAGRYVPAVVYCKGRPDLTLYIGNAMEAYERENDRIWTPHTAFTSWTGLDTAARVAEHLSRAGVRPRRIGLEYAFLPSDTERALTRAPSNVEYREAHDVLERLRARKTPAELALLRAASERVVDSMLEVMASHGPGTTTQQLFDALRQAEQRRGLAFEYCLVTAGASHNRAPSANRWDQGGIISLDSGGNYGGYIGDLCRMAILGEPDAELEDLLGGIEEVQQAARKPIRAGALGQEIYDAGLAAMARLPDRNITHFVAHGMGLISHEAPRLTGSGPVPYAGDHAALPLEAGMVLSIETTLPHPRRGYIKLEDTVAVTETGWEGFGDGARGWNRGGTRV